MRPDASLAGIDCNSVAPNCVALSPSILLVTGSLRSDRRAARLRVISCPWELGRDLPVLNARRLTALR